MNTEMIEDALERESVVEYIYTIIDRLSSKRKNSCFAIDGDWGSGKTYILTKLEEELRSMQSEELNSNRYCVFNYNCWEYDFYEEPTIAIMASIMDSMHDESGYSTDFKNALDFMKNAFLDVAGTILEKKIGYNFIDKAKEASQKTDEKNEQKHKFDELYSFRKTTHKIREGIAEIAKFETVVILVDEIDRCLPQYALKVLERLHHIFNDIENVIVVVSVDSKQLDRTINGIFGEDVTSEKYLQKIVDFNISIDNGALNYAIFEKYSEYFNQFVMDEKMKHLIIGMFRSMNIEIRGVKRMIEKAAISHFLLGTNDDSAALVGFEILFEIVKFKGNILVEKRVFNSINNVLIQLLGDRYDLHSDIRDIFGGLISFLDDEYESAHDGRIMKSESGEKLMVQNDSRGEFIYVIDNISGDNDSNLYLKNPQRNMEELIGLCRQYVYLSKDISY